MIGDDAHAIKPGDDREQAGQYAGQREVRPQGLLGHLQPLVLEFLRVERDVPSPQRAAGELLEKYPRTLYASMGALGSARYFFEKADLKSAKAQLQWVVDKTHSDEFRDVARLRMANVLLDEKAYDEGLKVLEEKHGEAFDAQFATLKGDLLVAKGQTTEAKAAYKAALEKADKKNTGASDSIQMRLDALGG